MAEILIHGEMVSAWPRNHWQIAPRAHSIVYRNRARAGARRRWPRHLAPVL